jgi:hypothetical protein
MTFQADGGTLAGLEMRVNAPPVLTKEMKGSSPWLMKN